MPEAALEYLQNHRVLYLATASKSGNPHVAPMFFVADSGGVYFSVASDSETARNLQENPIAEVVVADETSDPSSAAGVQVEGSVSQVSGGDADRIGRLFQEQFPGIGAGAAGASFWRLEPQDVIQLSNGGSHEETHQSLGQTWGKDHVSL
jgi:uncharacterized protein YhbP (UPF0306 family)